MFANAGIAHSAPFLEHPEAQWHRVLRVNLTGVFLCCQAAARQMVKQGGGRIITTASINGFRGVENLVGYNAAKAGVIELTRTMAVELAQHSITVNAIAPAQIDTRLTRSLPEEARRRRVERIPLGRFGEPEDVARAALFLASDDAATSGPPGGGRGYLAGGLWSSAPDPAKSVGYRRSRRRLLGRRVTAGRLSPACRGPVAAWSARIRCSPSGRRRYRRTGLPGQARLRMPFSKQPRWALRLPRDHRLRALRRSTQHAVGP
jgi:hypothetical protein